MGYFEFYKMGSNARPIYRNKGGKYLFHSDGGEWMVSVELYLLPKFCLNKIDEYLYSSVLFIIICIILNRLDLTTHEQTVN